MDFRTIQGCPVDKGIAPYIAIVCDDAKATVNSIYRGQDASWILHRHGKASQAELYDGWERRLPGYLPANPPGFSSHELRSDGSTFYGVPRGHPIPWWQQGFDVDDSDVLRVIAQAAWHGWKLEQPYHSGSEFHHFSFARRPRPTPHTLARIIRLRATLPHH